MEWNQNKNLRRQYSCHFAQHCINTAFFFSNIKIFKEQLYSQTLELRITFIGRFEDMAFDYYLSIPKSMLKWKLLTMLDKNSKIVCQFLYKRINNPLFREFYEIYIDCFYLKIIEKFLYPIHTVRCIITGPSNVGKSVFLTNLTLNIINEYDKIYIYSPSLHQDFYQKLVKCFSNYIPFHIIPNVSNEENIDIVIEEFVDIKDIETSVTEKEAFVIIQELRFPQDYEKNSIIILDDLNEKEINNDKIREMFERGRHNNLSLF